MRPFTRLAPTAFPLFFFLALFSFLAPPAAAAVTFNTTTPTQCEDWTISWNGGTPPFYLMIVPTMTITAGRIQNISLPVTGSAPYSYNFKLEQPAGLEFVIVLSDATGWGTGGVSEIMLVSSSPDLTCLTTDVFADFYFYTEPKDSPPMCSQMRVTWNDNATYPMGLHGLIPGGSAWDIPIPQTRESLSANWTVDIAHGTRFVLLMSDAGQYGTGGSTIPLTVQYSTDSSCLSEDSPRTTVVPSSSSIPTPSSSPSASSSSSPSKKSNTGAIVGGVVGGIVGLLILLAALWLCMRRRKRNDSDSGRPMGERREETRSRLLGRRNKARTSGHSGGERQAGFEIDVFEGQHPDSQSVAGEHSDSGDDHIQPYPYTHAPVGVPLRDSVLSTDTDGSRNSRVSFAGMGAGAGTSSSSAGQFGDKEVLAAAAALSTGGSTVQGPPSAHSRNSSVAMSQGARTNNGNNPDLYTVSELALASAASGRPVDREELLAIIDPPPKYKQYDALRANNPDANLNNPDAADPVDPTVTGTTTATSSRRTPRSSNEEQRER